MTIDSKTYLVPPGKKFNLSDWPTAASALTKLKSTIKSCLKST